MKKLLILGFALCTAWASAAFDLQFVSRYNSSAVCPTIFKRVLPTPNGFIVAGQVSEDILLATFDSYGSVIATQIWDSPRVGIDEVKNLVRADDGSLYLFAEHQNQAAYIVKFNASLILQWEREVVPGESFNALADTSVVDGRTHMAIHHRDSNRLRLYGWTSDGTALTVVNRNGLPAGFEMYDLDTVDGTASGYVLGGKRNDHEFFIRYNGVSTAAYDVTLGGTANSQNRILDLVALPDLTVVAVGVGYNATSQAAIYSVSSTGVVARTLRSEGADLRSLQKIGANLYQAILRIPVGNSSDYEVVRFNSTNRTFTKRFGPHDGISNHLALSNSSDVLLMGSSIGARIYDEATESERWGLSFGEGYYSSDLAEVGSTAVGVGYATSTPTTLGALYFVANDSLETVSMGFVGGVRRTPVAKSVVSSDGAITTVSNDSDKAIVTRYRADGTLAYARTVQIPGVSYFNPVSLAVGPSGEVVVLGAAGYSGSPAWAKLSPTGTLEYTKTLVPFPSANPMSVGIDSTGSVYLAGAGFKAGDVRSWLAKYSSSGVLNFVNDYVVLSAPNNGYTLQQGFVMANNRVYLSNCASTSTNGITKVRQINSSTGASQDSYDLNDGFLSYLSADSTGNILLAVRGSADVKLRKLQGVGVSNQLATKSYAGATLASAIAPSANGNSAVAIDQGGQKLILLDGSWAEIANVPVEPTVSSLKDLICDGSNNIYLLGEEDGANNTVNVYAAKYLSTGIRSAQRRTAGKAQNLALIPGGGVWISGQVGTRKKGWGPFVAKYTN